MTHTKQIIQYIFCVFTLCKSSVKTCVTEPFLRYGNPKLAQRQDFFPLLSPPLTSADRVIPMQIRFLFYRYQFLAAEPNEGREWRKSSNEDKGTEFNAFSNCLIAWLERREER